MIIKRFFHTSLVISFLALSISGCSTTSGQWSKSDPRVSVSRMGRITVDGKGVNLADLSGRLKSLGAIRGTSILISVPKDIDGSTLMEISRILSIAGFPKVLFIKPTQVSASTKARR